MPKEKQLSKSSTGRKQMLKGERKNRAVEHHQKSKSENYVVGQVLGSLCQTSATNVTSSPLISLFSTAAPAMQPVFVPVDCAARKQKDALGGKRTGRSEGQPPSWPQVFKKTEVSKERTLMGAEKKHALVSTDQEEERGSQSRISRGGAFWKRTSTCQRPSTKEGGEICARLSKEEECIRNKRTLFVGNLPVTFTKQMLKALFREFGTVESVRFRSIARAEATLSRKLATIQRQTHAKRNNINAYVVFCEQASAAKALVKNGMEVASGFHIRVDLANEAASHDNRLSVFLGNLPYEVEEEGLRELFSDCGQVAAVRIIRDRDTGMGKGFGYILFKDIDAVQLALGLDGANLLGRKLRVKRCARKEKVAGKPGVNQVIKKSYVTKTGLSNRKLQPANHYVGRRAKLGKNKKIGNPASISQKGGQAVRHKTQAGIY
ncbi:RNA-binding protein 34 [Microcaecilia unicolor]|uniref:RNA-binding protein 34 n=1 Tax=Microcaecilia unicolor TaxID=1415580 RepID=A0A6P7ZBE8_9AMPH|nr:RNA-binding protein 34 [Microcaecilia unicolor]XP_030074969.1 RNA-binding protein 34 [Microcaecilia unicolor]